MKRVFLLVALVCGMAFQANAQEEGQVWVGGTIGFSSTKEKDLLDIKVNRFTFSPEIGYAFSDNWGAGIKLGINSFKIKGGNEIKLNGFTIEPFARYTFLKWKAVSVFMDGGVFYQTNKLKVNLDEEDFDIGKRNFYGVSIDPGFSVRLSNTIALKGQINLFKARFGAYKTSDDFSDEEFKISRSSVKLNSPFSLNDINMGLEFRF